MKKIYALLATLLLTIGVTAQSYNTNRGFVHPGGLHTQEDFDRIKDLLAKGDPHHHGRRQSADPSRLRTIYRWHIARANHCARWR